MSSGNNGKIRALHQLARLYRVQVAYRDILVGRRRQASPEALLAVLRALGAPVCKLEDVRDAVRERQQAVCERCVDPVLVAWDAEPPKLTVRLAAGAARTRGLCHLRSESGETRSWITNFARLAPQEQLEAGSEQYLAKQLALPQDLPIGYHQLTLQTSGKAFQTFIIRAPAHAYTADEGQEGRAWGVFVPLYALHSRTSWGVGDFSDLRTLLEWLELQGGSVLGTLPLLATFLDRPFEPSPYAPVSRLFWNELFLDLTAIPEFHRCSAARALVATTDFQAELDELRSAPRVEYRRAMALKRRCLDELTRFIFADSSSRRVELQKYVDSHPFLKDYAIFRAVCARRRASWWTWPQPLRDGAVRDGDYDREAMRYHLYVQWLAHEQLSNLAAVARQSGRGLYVDLPLGTNPDGYDVWRERSVFALDVSAGAPPDSFFTKGQNWGFPPLHPERLREQGYRYFIASIQNHLRYAGVLRIDHAMGLHRLFWVPKGFPALEGVYVHYRAEELHGILALESYRNKALLVGEDLGTVPRYVRPTLARHKVQRMYVLPFELSPNPKSALCPAPTDSLACMNTHDMPTFASFWRGLDIQDRVELGLLDQATARREWTKRQKLKGALLVFLRHNGYLEKGRSEASEVLSACLKFLGSTRSRLVIVNLEDLWLEPLPQNVPGTHDERPNWRRKARYALETISRLPEVVDALQKLDRSRRRTAVERRRWPRGPHNSGH